MFFFFNDTATTEIYTLSLHDALPISRNRSTGCRPGSAAAFSSSATSTRRASCSYRSRSEEHTSELQSRENLVCRLLLEKKKKRDEPSYRQPTGWQYRCGAYACLSSRC